MPDENYSEEIKVRLTPTQLKALEKFARNEQSKPATEARVAIHKLLLREDDSYKATFEKETAEAGAKKKKSPSRKVAHLTDKDWVSLSIYSDIPAGWAEDIQSLTPKRTTRLHKSIYQPGMFGLDVTGESMNAAKGKFGPILPGETVLVMPFNTASEVAGKVVAANIDGRTTLKRMVCPKDAPCHLQPESTAPEFAGKMCPLDNITVLGVVVGKL